MSFGSPLLPDSKAVGDSSVTHNITSGEAVTIEGKPATLPPPKRLCKGKSVGFVSAGKVRWFMKNESITAATFQDEEYNVDFSEDRRKVLRKQVVKSERVQSMPFSMSLLDNGAFAMKESSNKQQVFKPIITSNTKSKKQIQVVLLQSQ